MTTPLEYVATPDHVVDLAAGREVTAVWRNDLGGVTFSLGAQEFVKVYPDEHAAMLVAEAERMQWAIEYEIEPDEERLEYYRVRWAEESPRAG